MFRLVNSIGSVFRQKKELRGRVDRKRSFRSLLIEGLEKREVFAAFTAGNLVVLQLNTAGLTVANNGAGGSFVEFTTSGSVPIGGANVIPIPTQATANSGGATFSGTATSAPALSISGNGQFITTIGYDAPINSSGVSNSTAATFNRNVVQVDTNGTVSIPVRLTNALSGNNARDAVTNDGTGYWVAGQPGIQYATPSAVPKVIDGTIAATNNRDISIVGGTLVSDTNTALTRFTGLPITTDAGTSFGLALSDAYAYQFLDRAAGVGDAALGGIVDTLYVANNNATNTIAKYSFNGSTWATQGVATLAGQTLFGLVGRVNGSNAELFATTNTQASSSLRSFVDTAAYNATIAGSFSTLSTAPPNTFYRGISFAPASASIATTTTLTAPISPINFGDSVTFEGTISAASGTSSPIGTIEIRDGSSTGTLFASTTTFTGSGATVNYSVSTTTIPQGTYTNLRAYYVAGSGFSNSSSAAVSLTVNGTAVNTTTSLASISPLSASFGSNITFAGTVTAASGTDLPDGTVNIYSGGVSGTLLASGPVGGTGASGTFSISSTSIALGNYNAISAVYVPTNSTAFVTSSSSVFGSTLSIFQPTTTVLVSINPASVFFGQNVTYAGTITPAAGTSLPSGTISIYDGGIGGTLLGSTSTIGGTAPNGTFSITATAPAIGTYSNIAAYFVPTGTFGSSNSAVFSTPLVVSAAPQNSAFVSYTTAGSSYAQSFDGLPSSGTFTLSGSGPFQLGAAPIIANGLDGWQIFKSGGSGANALFFFSDGTPTTGGAYSFGTTSTSDRALGGVSTGTTTMTWGVSIRNNTSSTLSDFTLGFTAEQWRQNTGSTNNSAFSYQVGSAGLLVNDTTGTWTTVPAGDLTTINNGSSGALNGNLVANQATKSVSATGLTWAAGQDLVLRWVQTGTNSPGMAIDNLTFSATGATTVTPTVSINNTLSGNAKVYDGIAYTATASVTGGNASTPLPTFTYFVGANTSGTNLGATPPINVGTYTVVASVAAALGSNAASSSPYTYSITAKELTVTSAVASNKAYDATNSAVITGTLSGVIGSDSVTFTGTGTFASTGVNNGIAVTSTSTLSGPGAGNYSLTQPTGLTANITPKELTLTSPLASNKAYDATNAAVITGTLSGVIGSEIVTFTGTGTFASTGVNDGIAVTSTSTLGGTDAGNYSLVQPTGLTANITPKELTGSITASNKIFNGNDAATIVTRSLSGVIGSEVVSYVGGTATFDTAAVGTGKVVTATGLSLSGADSGNYSVNTSATTVADVLAVGTIQTRGVRYLGATGTSAANNLATDKTALLPGQNSSFSNYTNYVRGLNGVVIDIANLPASTTPTELLASLQFASWNGIGTANWVAVAAVPTITIASGDGASGSARVQIQFPDNAIQNTWLRVTVVAGLTTALTANDVFYFGNVIGDFGQAPSGSPLRYRVNATDTGAVRSNQSTAANSAPVTNIYDVDRNGRVNATDTGIVRSNQQTAGIVAPITIPGSVPPSAPAGFGFVTPPMKGTPAPVVSAGKVGTEGTKVEDVRNTVNTSVSADILNLAAISKTTTVQQETVVSASGRSDTSTNEVDSNLQSLDEYFASIWKS